MDTLAFIDSFLVITILALLVLGTFSCKACESRIPAASYPRQKALQQE